jgi:hypothetical protein
MTASSSACATTTSVDDNCGKQPQEDHDADCRGGWARQLVLEGENSPAVPRQRQSGHPEPTDGADSKQQVTVMGDTCLDKGVCRLPIACLKAIGWAMN